MALPLMSEIKKDFEKSNIRKKWTEQEEHDLLELIKNKIDSPQYIASKKWFPSRSANSIQKKISSLRGLHEL